MWKKSNEWRARGEHIYAHALWPVLREFNRHRHTRARELTLHHTLPMSSCHFDVRVFITGCKHDPWRGGDFYSTALMRLPFFFFLGVLQRGLLWRNRAAATAARVFVNRREMWRNGACVKAKRVLIHDELVWAVLLLTPLILIFVLHPRWDGNLG